MIDPLLIAKPRRDWLNNKPADLALLATGKTPLARAIRQAQRYFTDQELTTAIEGRSKTVLLTMIDDEPVFLNASMIADVMTGLDSPLEQDVR